MTSTGDGSGSGTEQVSAAAATNDEPMRSGARREISRRVVALLKEYVGRGPTSARTYCEGDLVVVVLGDTLTKGEKMLAGEGEIGLVREMRRAFIGTMREEISTVVSEEVGRPVTAVLGDHCVDPDFAIAACLLDSVGEPNNDNGGATRTERKEISRGMSALYKDLIGRGATETRTFIEDEIVAVLLSDTLTQAEKTLAADERPRTVSELRREFQGAMKQRAVALVEGATGYKVQAFLSDHSIVPDYALEVFLLDRETPTDRAAVEAAHADGASVNGASVDGASTDGAAAPPAA